jgi:hypothetical protein
LNVESAGKPIEDEKGTHTLSNQSLPLPPRILDDLPDRRQEILKDAASAEVDLGVDLHAGDKAQLPALAFEVAAAQVD